MIDFIPLAGEPEYFLLSIDDLMAIDRSIYALGMPRTRETFVAQVDNTLELRDQEARHLSEAELIDLRHRADLSSRDYGREKGERRHAREHASDLDAPEPATSYRALADGVWRLEHPA